MIYSGNFFDTYWFPITLGVVILLSIVAFICTGFIFVSRDRIAVIERVGKYVGTYKSGLYFFAPLLYRRVGYYKKGVTVQRLRIKDETYIVTYQIENYKTWHYVGNHDSLGIVRSSLNQNPQDLSKLLIERFSLVGVKFISLERMKK